jgi:hypothetical protein
VLDWGAYFDRLIRLKIEFELAKKALTDWSANPEMRRKHAEEDLNGLRAMILESLEKQSLDEKSHWISNPQSVTAYLESAKKQATEGATAFKSRLSQNEFLLQVAIFEGFLKDLHKAILKTKPELLRADRAVPLGKLVAQGRDALIAEEIDREVQTLDRQSVKKKADYFTKRLGIDWFGLKIVPIMDAVINARNEILHENADREISQFELIGLPIVTIALPLTCAAQAAVLYPGSCKLPDHIDEGTVRASLLPK